MPVVILDDGCGRASAIRGACCVRESEKRGAAGMLCGERESLRNCDRPSLPPDGRLICGALLPVGRCCESADLWKSCDSALRCHCGAGRFTKFRCTLTFLVTFVTWLTTTTRCACQAGRLQKTNPAVT